MSQLIHLFTIRLYLFNTLLKKKYNRENKQIKKFSNIGQSKTKTIVILDEDPSKEHITCAQ
jgi:adenine C2-methylase RlmN of 23S rRNA A2503 and tRNA A37